MAERAVTRFMDRWIPRGLWISPIEIVGAGLAGAALLWMSTLSDDLVEEPLFLAPLAASIAILFTTPGTTATRAWNVVAGQVLSAAIALVVVAVLPMEGGKVAAPIAFSLALLVMYTLRCMHPPACATVMIVCFTPVAQHPIFLIFPLLVGSILIVLFAWLVHVVEARVPPRWGGRLTPGHGEPPAAD